MSPLCRYPLDQPNNDHSLKNVVKNPNIVKLATTLTMMISETGNFERNVLYHF